MARRYGILMFLLLGCLLPAASAQEKPSGGVRGTLQAVCADPDGRQWAVTDAGEILRSPDGSAWTVFDFNANYAGYYPRMRFLAVAAVIGQQALAHNDVRQHICGARPRIVAQPNLGKHVQHGPFVTLGVIEPVEHGLDYGTNRLLASLFIRKRLVDGNLKIVHVGIGDRLAQLVLPTKVVVEETSRDAHCRRYVGDRHLTGIAFLAKPACAHHQSIALGVISI